VTLHRLGWSGLWLGVRVAGWRLVVPVLKRVLPAERLVRRMAAPPGHMGRAIDQGLLERLVRGLFRGRDDVCFDRSLVLYRYLARAGRSPRLLLGFSSEGDGIIGHAWVEVEGQRLLEPPESIARWTSVVAFDAAGGRV